VLAGVTQTDQLESDVQQAIIAFKRLAVVVNNAGYGSLGSIEEITEEETRRQFDVNVFGPARLHPAASRQLVVLAGGHKAAARQRHYTLETRSTALLAAFFLTATA